MRAVKRLLHQHGLPGPRLPVQPTRLRIFLAPEANTSAPKVSCALSSEGDTHATSDVLELPPAAGQRRGGAAAGVQVHVS